MSHEIVLLGWMLGDLFINVPLNALAVRSLVFVLLAGWIFLTVLLYMIYKCELSVFGALWRFAPKFCIHCHLCEYWKHYGLCHFFKDVYNFTLSVSVSVWIYLTKYTLFFSLSPLSCHPPPLLLLPLVLFLPDAATLLSHFYCPVQSVSPPFWAFHTV